MNRTDVVLTLKDGVRRTVQGYLVAPGLAVHRATPAGDGLGDLTNDWVVTHMKSGLYVGGSFRLRKDAERAGKVFSEIADWTDPHVYAVPGLGARVLAIRNRILAESDGLPVKSVEKAIQETTPLSNEPIRAAHLLYAHDVSALNQKFVERFESSLVRTEIEVLEERIAKGHAWLVDKKENGTLAEFQKGRKLIESLQAQLARVRYENELPAEVLGFINALVHSTTRYNLKIPGAYVRVVIPEVLTFEADLIHEDIPF